MITDILHRDVFESDLPIIFGCCTQGRICRTSVDHFASRLQVFYPTAYVKHCLGDVVKHSTPRDLYGLVCFTGDKFGAWENAPQHLKVALGKLPLPIGQPVASVLIGASRISEDCGADWKENLRILHESPRPIFLYLNGPVSPKVVNQALREFNNHRETAMVEFPENGLGHA